MTGLTASHLAQTATGSLVAAVWQGILLAAAAGLGLRLLPKTPAAVRFAIWFGVFVVVTALPLVSLWPHATSPATGGAWFTVDARWSLAIAGVWAIASVVRAGTLVMAAFRVRQLWKRARPVESMHPTHRRRAMDGAPELFAGDGSRRAAVCTSDEVDRPTVIGFFSPKILIPGWLLEKLTAAELEQVVLHESGHLGRADDWMNLVQKIGLVVFPLNPALAWVERRLCFERELACDERVLQTTGAPKAYAACLATLAEYRLGRRGLSLAIGLLGRESELGKRIGRILRRGEGMRPLHVKLVLGGAMLGLLAAAAGLQRCPQVIGFEAGNQVQSAGNREQLTGIRGQGTTGEVRNGYGYQPVVFHADDLRRLGEGPGLKPSHAVAPLPRAEARRYSGKATAVSSRPVSLVRTSVQAGGAAQRNAPVVRQWIVVRTWQDADGSRVVLTTAEMSNYPPDAAPADRTQPQSTQEIHPYATVPVRGGWLIFQL